MITQQLIATIADNQREHFLQKEIGIPREALSTIPIVKGFATIITGIRRCGKSTLLLQLLKERYQDAFFLNFEDTRLAGMDSSDFGRLSNEISQRGTKVLFFDEIQSIEGWEIFIHQLLREDYQVFITGSNASLLSRELGTHLTGRHLSIELFPFSFTEFCQFKQLKTDEQAFNEYLITGGMPDYLHTGLGQYLNSLLDDILVRDIAIRHNIKDINSLRQLCVFLLSNIGNPISANKLTGMFGVKSSSTLLDYFSFLQDAYLLEFIPLFDYSLKKQIRNPKKVYAIDTGIYKQNSTLFSENTGHALENAVYLNLRLKEKEIYYFQQKGECDFVTIRKGKADQLIQVCSELNEMNLQRETEGLFSAMEFFDKKEGTIITLNQSDSFTQNNKTIRVVPAYKFTAT
ncbi:ATP-binding protein [uncultured Parabacteroides sp.]|uniref:ATP-binding protein n=1 Tax=uncultured Parabacteroides sp. TaxID=512312 RepID=UPI00260134E1|nr:ATP-binding protein [uncultured Parabacteroides sp.]